VIDTEKIALQVRIEYLEEENRRYCAARYSTQAAYNAITAALADVEVPVHLDKGQPCLDKIAALKAERDDALAQLGGGAGAEATIESLQGRLTEAQDAHIAERGKYELVLDVVAAARAAVSTLVRQMQTDDPWPLRSSGLTGLVNELEAKLEGSSDWLSTWNRALRGAELWELVERSAPALATVLRELKERRNNWAASLAQLQAKAGDQGSDVVTASYERTIAEVDEAIAVVKQIKEGV
jgi:hypothetical protein